MTVLEGYQGLVNAVVLLWKALICHRNRDLQTKPRSFKGSSNSSQPHVRNLIMWRASLVRRTVLLKLWNSNFHAQNKMRILFEDAKWPNGTCPFQKCWYPVYIEETEKQSSRARQISKSNAVWEWYGVFQKIQKVKCDLERTLINIKRFIMHQVSVFKFESTLSFMKLGHSRNNFIPFLSNRRVVNFSEMTQCHIVALSDNT